MLSFFKRLLTHNRIQPAVHPRMIAADMGRDADSPQIPPAHSSCWKLDIEPSYPFHLPSAEHIHIRPLGYVVHAQTLWRGPKSDFVDFDYITSRARRSATAMQTIESKTSSLPP
jgi:hypothetical protein